MDAQVDEDSRPIQLFRRGVDAEFGRLRPPGERIGRGTGLKSMRERARRLGATLTIDSEPGRGTTARLTVRKTRMRRSRPTVAS
jgi:nitrate/nitrite-specific signal transduction histidine kinase